MKSQEIKKSVKFDQPQATEQNHDKNKNVKYLPALAARQLVVEAINECNSKIRLYTQNDPQIKRKDTAQSMATALESLKFALMHLNIGTHDDKQQNYYLCYNGTILIYEICQQLRHSNFHSLTLDYLGFCITSLECHLILLNIKYLEWRVKLYVELARTYEEIGSNEISLKAIELGIKKVLELQQILEQDPPMPGYVLKILENSFRALRVLEIKYRLQIGNLAGDAWKKRLDEVFNNDKEGRIAAIVESLRTKNFCAVDQKGKGLTWKELAIKQTFDGFKGEINIICDYIKQIMALINVNQSENQTEEQRIKIFQEKMALNPILESRFKDAVKSIPLEYHVELCLHAYDVANLPIFEELSNQALIRCKYRRIEAPFITDIKIVMSSHPNPNIPNGYEKIEQDINEANLKILLKKNRIFKEDKSVQQAPDPKAAAKDSKKGAKVPDPKEVKQEESQVKYQEAIPGIKHQYTYILVKRSISPENAICGFKLVLAQESNPNSSELKPLIDAGWRVIECPVQQYTGVRETNKQAIFVCFKSTSESLKDEEEKKSLLLDIKPVFAKSPLARPDLGYQKIDIDLRQTPKEFIKHPDNDYLYLTYKQDRHYYTNERELQLIMDLYQLEKTKAQLIGVEGIRAQELGIEFDQQLLDKIFKDVKSALEGPLGSLFYQDRKDFLFQLMFFLWKKYMVLQLYQIEHLLDQVLQGELSIEEMEQYQQHFKPLQSIYKLGLKIINLILVRDPTRSLIWYIKSTLELTKLLMQDDENHEASQFVKTCYDMVVIYRDETLQRGVESKKDLFLPYSITSSNNKIGVLFQNMMNSYIEFKNEQGCKIREKQREKDLKQSLSIEEQREELSEILNYKLIVKNDDNKDKSYFEHLPQESYISQMDLIINTLQLELIMCYYRCQIKEGKKLEKMSKTSQKTNELCSETMNKKLQLSKGKSFLDTKQKLQTLQTDLQNAGRLPVPQPQIKDYEKRLKAHSNKNPYLMAVLNMLMACNKKQSAEKNYLLNQSMEEIQKAVEMEDELCKQATQDSIYICSTLLDNKITEKISNSYEPFDRLYDQTFVPETDYPRTPILISRSSSSITLKLPPFNPKVSELDYLSDPGVKDIRSMVLYGKVAAHGVNVSTTCTDLQNTGIRNQIGSVIQIRGLSQNEGYCFAVAGFNVNEKQSKKIGETSQQILTLQPFPINQLYAHLAKYSYWLSDYAIAQQAADKNIAFFVEKSKIQDKVLDSENPSVFFRIKQKTFKDVSNLEICSFAESLFIKARCMQKSEKNLKTIDKHKFICQQINFSLLALEACQICQSWILGKRILIDLYNNLQEIIKIKSKYLFQILIKMYIFKQEIPKQYWDHNLRQLSAKLIYQVSTICFQYNQINLGKLVIYQSTYLPNRKYKPIPKLSEITNDQNPVAQQKGKKDQVQVQQTENQAPVFKTTYSLTEMPSYQDFLEDSLLNFSEEYGDFVSGFLDNWKEQLDYYAQYLENGQETVENIKNQLMIRWNFWEMLKEPNSALQKITLQFKQNPMYVEMLCKFARRQIEQNNLKSAKEILNQVEPVITDCINVLLQIFQIKLECAQNDIAWQPDKLETLKSESESNGEIENKSINLFTKFYELQKNLKKDQYQTLWRAEFYYLKALTLYLEKQLPVKETSPDIYFEMDRLDLEKISIHFNEIKELNTRNLSQEDMDFFKELQKTLALASFFSVESNAEFQLKNIVKFAQNINIREQMNPFDHRNTDTNLYSMMIGEAMLTNFSLHKPSPPYLITILTKDFWFNPSSFSPYSSFSSFIINSLLIEEKHSLLSHFTTIFCNVTQHFYSNIVFFQLQTIPFMIHALSNLEEKASKLTMEREAFLEQRTQEYELWKNGKRRKNRAAMLTGEIPPEELSYQQDKEVITQQIRILRQKQENITQKKEVASNVLSEIQRDANQAQLMLFECKRLLEKFGEDYKVVLADTSQQQKKPHQMFGQTLVRKYKQVIDMLRKRHDNVGLIRALSQIGDLFFAQNLLDQAEENWNDALDTIFQKLHSLKNQHSFQIENISERNLLLACVFLYKLSKFCYFANFQMQKQCHQFAAALTFQVFKTSMVNPQTLIAFADQRNIYLAEDLFNESLDPIDCIQAMDYLQKQLYDSEMYLEALPLIQIMDYLSVKLTQSDFYSSRAKLFKSLILSKIGMINQSYQLLMQVQQEKCGPIQVLQLNENINLNKGENWFPNNKEFINHMPFFQDQNKEVIDILQKLEIPQNFELKHSQLNSQLFVFSKICLLLAIHEQEIIDRPENNEQRLLVLRSLEAQLRTLMVQIQKAIEINQQDWPLSLSQAQEERYLLLYRSRFTLGQLTLCMGQITRAYFVFKQGIQIILAHIFDFPLENGREVENEEVIVQAKDAKKDTKKEVKKGAKVVEEVKEVEQKLEMNWDQLNQKNRKHLNGIWFLKFKLQIILIYYQQNRFDNCLFLIEKMQKDCKQLSDKTTSRIITEIQARIHVRQGLSNEGITLLKECASENSSYTTYSGQLFGDLGEILFERNQYQEAHGYFLQAVQIFSYLKDQFRFNIQNSINKNAEIEKVKLNEKFQYPTDIMDQLSKKEAKIRKDDRGKQKETKKDTKGQKTVEVVELKVQLLNPLEKNDLMQSLKPILKDYQAEIQQSSSIYIRFLEDYLRACLRLARCELTLKKFDQLLENLDKIQIFINGNYNLPQSFKLELNYLFAIANKRIFIQKIEEYYIPYIDKYLNEKNKKYKKIHDRLPYRDLPRNRYLLELPNFSQYLKNTLIPNYLEKSKKHFRNCISIIKGECIYFEFSLSVSQLLMEMAELILLQREYCPRLEFKYINHDEDDRWERLANMEKLDKLNFELESFQIIGYSMQGITVKKEILEKSLGAIAIPDPTKIPIDLVAEILETDFIYKKKYDQLLFDETKNKKLQVNSLDLVSLLNKLEYESKIMTFSGNKCQKTIQKIHRFLKSYHNVYMQKCMLSQLEITPKSDLNVVFIEDGVMKIKSIYNEVTKEHKFVYILSRYNKAKITSNLSKDELDKLLVTDDKEILYGNIYVSADQLSNLELKVHNLKSKLQESELKEKSVKERDFRRHNKDFIEIFDILGKLFHARSNQGARKTAQVEYEIINDKFSEFIPQLTIQNVNIFVQMFGSQGLEVENHNLIVIFRNFHKAKYR